ncbi:hypothetical protein BBJ28_00004582 [Nothophytophthora sp. Chile5]|nr:hypothetical protein BBJ28_00004582 [Nothophytophthora sp. Chile5]
MKLAKAAAQHLKGVIVEYDVLCSTLIGESMAEQAEQRRRKLAADKAKQQKEERFGSSLFGPSSVQSMLISDVRGLLKDLNQDSTGKPWARVTGSPDQEKAAAGKSEDEIHLENQLASASETLARMKQQKEAARREKEQLGKLDLGRKSGSSSSLRDKYLDKISKLKEKKKQEASDMSVPEPVVEPVAVTSAGLSTWIVNDGANEVLVRLVPFAASNPMRTDLTIVLSFFRATRIYVACSRL